MTPGAPLPLPPPSLPPRFLPRRPLWLIIAVALLAGLLGYLALGLLGQTETRNDAHLRQRLEMLEAQVRDTQGQLAEQHNRLLRLETQLELFQAAKRQDRLLLVPEPPPGGPPIER